MNEGYKILLGCDISVLARVRVPVSPGGLHVPGPDPGSRGSGSTGDQPQGKGGVGAVGGLQPHLRRGHQDQVSRLWPGGNVHRRLQGGGHV